MLLSKVGKSDTLQGDFDRLQQDFDDLRVSRAAFVEEVSELKGEIGRLSIELNRARNQNAKLVNDLNALQDENEVLRAARNGDNSGASRWEQRARDAESLNRRLEDEMRTMRGDMTDQNSSRNRSLEDLERTVRQLENELLTTRRAHHEEITILQRESKRWNSAGSGASSTSSLSRNNDYANADLSGRAYEDQSTSMLKLSDASSRRQLQGYESQYSRYESGSVARGDVDEDKSLPQLPPRPKHSYSDPDLPPVPNQSSTRSMNSSTTSLPSQSSSRTQTLGALRQSLASVVQTAESMGRNYPNIPQVESRAATRALSDVYQQQKQQAPAAPNSAPSRSDSAARRRTQGGLSSTPSPFATESTSVELMEFEVLEKNLTKLMTEKTSLDTEIEKYVYLATFEKKINRLSTVMLFSLL